MDAGRGREGARGGRRGRGPSRAGCIDWDAYLDAAGLLDWSPEQFWGATVHDFTAAVWSRQRRAEPERRELTDEQMVGVLSARAAAGA